jgi:hypothetical protein
MLIVLFKASSLSSGLSNFFPRELLLTRFFDTMRRLRRFMIEHHRLPPASMKGTREANFLSSVVCACGEKLTCVVD